MKVTVKTKETKKEIKFEDIKSGQIFEYKDGVIALKLTHNEAALLTFPDGEILYCQLAKGYKTMPIKKVLGKLVEIVVE